MGRTSDADERLMTAARDLMWEESYGSVTIDDICNRAGVKKGSFYYFFDSKAALAVAALEKLWTDDWKPKMDARFSPSVEPLERIRGYLEAHYTMQCQVQKDTGKVLGCPVCSLGSEISTQEIDVGAKVREIFARKRKYLESAIRDAMAELRKGGGGGAKPPGADGEVDDEPLREAWMRKTIREAQKEGFARVAVVCGAWHAPVLDPDSVPKKDDDERLKGLRTVGSIGIDAR